MKNLFRKYYHSVLNPDEFSRVIDYLGNKNNESTIFCLMKPLWDKELKETDIPSKTNPALYKRIKESVLMDKQQTAQRKIVVFTWALRVAAVLVVALLVSNILFFQRSVNNQIDQTLQTISAPYGAKTNFTLPDGSLVWLNSGSTLSYPSRFSNNRMVKLLGEAFFEVEKNNMPFIVSTDYGDVKVKGTSFNVKAFVDDHVFETTLEEGVVTFKSKNAPNEVTLKPGEQVAKTETGFLIQTVETKYFTSWKEGKLLFNKEPFPGFIKKLERWYNVKIEYHDPKLDELWYTGTIEMESISEVMELIREAAPVSYSFNNKTRVFTIKPDTR